MNEISLKEYFEAQIRAIEVAVRKAEIQLDRRLDGMNEFRESLRDQSSKFVTKSEADIVHKALEEKVRALELAAVKTSLFVSLGTSLIVGIVMLVITHVFLKP